MAIPPHRSRLTSAGILLAATIGNAIAGIHFQVVGAMIKPLGDAYGWSRGDVAFALTITTIIHPFTNILIGLLSDRLGPRVIALPGIVCFSLSSMLLGLAGPALWTWYAGYIVYAMFSAGVSSIIWTMIIVEHFDKRRGIALAIALAGAGILVSVVPTLVLLLQREFGLRGVYPAIGVISLLLMFVPSYLFIPRETTKRVRLAHAESPAREWRSVIGSWPIWRFGIGIMLIGGCVGTFIVHLQPMLADAGLSRESAAHVALFIGPAMVIGRIGTGALFDVLPPRLVAACAFTLPGFACLWLLALPLTAQSANVLAVLIGLGMGSEVDVVAYLTSHYFGLKRYGLIFGLLSSLYALAIGIAAWIVGTIFDAVGTYDGVLLFLAAGVPVAVMLVLSLGRIPAVDRPAMSSPGGADRRAKLTP